MRGHRHCLPVLFVLFVGACDDDAGFFDARPPDAMIPTGTFSLSWSITDTVTGDTITCDDANATSVSVTVREVNSAQGTTDSLSCASGSGTSSGVLPGTYMLGFSLRGPDGEVATAPSVTDVVIVSNQDTPVTPPLAFSVEARGQFVVRLTAAPLTSNCDAAPTGANIDGVVLTLTKAGTCVPVIYDIGAGTYNAGCPASELNGCIEQDQDITSPVIPSGTYDISAVGNIGNDSCWMGTRQLRVPTAGATAPTQTLGMAYQEGPGCPPL